WQALYGAVILHSIPNFLQHVIHPNVPQNTTYSIAAYYGYFFYLAVRLYELFPTKHGGDPVFLSAIVNNRCNCCCYTFKRNGSHNVSLLFDNGSGSENKSCCLLLSDSLRSSFLIRANSTR